MWRLATHPDVRIVSAALACCALEVEAAAMAGLLIPETQRDPNPRTTVLVVAGTVTTALAPVLVHRLAQLSEQGPVRVMAFGACATSGGPYWDAPTVTNGMERLGPVHTYVPGCPPNPQALVAELERLADVA